MRMSDWSSDVCSSDLVEMLNALLAVRPSTRQQPAGFVLGGTREAAKIMSSARKATGERVMPKLAKIDRETAKAIEEAMFVFENLLEMDDKNLGTFIRNVDGDVLTKAPKGDAEGVRNRFLGCMSQPPANGIRHEVDAPGPLRRPAAPAA